MRLTLSFLTSILLLCLLVSMPLGAQDAPRFHRVYLADKGTPFRYLLRGDPSYYEAIAHLSPRALQRRAKVLHRDSLVSTLDLPIPQKYLRDIEATGAIIIQTSRWMNSVMVMADSQMIVSLRALPFVDSAVTARAFRKPDDSGFDKSSHGTDPIDVSNRLRQPGGCIVERYGSAEIQNLQIGIDAAHRMGIAGEQVLVGVLDAGFDWRNHIALKDLDVWNEYDFVDHDSVVADDPGAANGEFHGTMVTSMIGAFWDGRVIGGAPRASFILAKTEDVRSERHVEEDNFVAGLEWLESQGVDVTNTSLGYTTFDAPETGHAYEELTGHTAFASRAVNHAVRLGVVCVVAAGNDYSGYHYIGVPAEADSAIAVAAVDSTGMVTTFSSRGFNGRKRIKPDVSAPGRRIAGADPLRDSLITIGPGTSFAAPLVTSAVAVLLSAAPELKPYEIRSLLTRTADRAASPDTTYGHGMIDVGAALDELSRTRPIVGFPSVLLQRGRLSITAAVQDLRPTAASDQRSQWLKLRVGRGDMAIVLENPQPVQGYASWTLSAEEMQALGELQGRDEILELVFILNDAGGSNALRQSRVQLTSSFARPRSLVCTSHELTDSTFAIATAVPNPFRDRTILTFSLPLPASSVEVVVYNALGQEVARPLHSTDLDAGQYSIPFDATGLAAGAYYYQLRYNDVHESGQMIFLP